MMHDDAVERRTHVFGDSDRDLGLVADLQRGSHGHECNVRTVTFGALPCADFGARRNVACAAVRYTCAVIGLLTLLAVAFVLLIAVFTGVLTYEMRHPPRRTAAYAIARGLHVDPESAGLPFREWSVEANGVTLPVWDIQSNQTSEVTAVFVHGWGQSRIDMLARIGPWPELVNRLITYDLRGHGEATGVSNLGVGEARDLIAVLDAIENGPIVLVGYSMGAVIAIEAAAMDSSLRERIAGVVAFGPYNDFHTSLRGRLNVAGYPARPITDLALFALRMMGMRHTTLAPHAARLNCPLLIIHGERDRVVPITQSELLAHTAPHGTLRTIATAAHLDVHLVDEDAVREAVVEFVGRVRLRNSRDAAASLGNIEQPSNAQ
jgi:pimeloyl-ACP methyl ester carboxylesterase